MPKEKISLTDARHRPVMMKSVVKAVFLSVASFCAQAYGAQDQDKGDAWRSVAGIRGKISIEYRSGKNEQTGFSHETMDETASIQVDFTMKRVRPREREVPSLPAGASPQMAEAMRAIVAGIPTGESTTEHLSWKADKVKITGVAFKTTDQKFFPYKRHFTTRAEIQGTSLHDFVLELHTGTGVWQLASPRLREKYQIVLSGTEQNLSSKQVDVLDQTWASDNVHSMVFDGSLAGKPGMVHGKAKVESSGMPGQGTLWSSTIGRLEFWPEHVDAPEVEITIDDYENWRPEGSIQRPTEPAKHLIARATLVPKGTMRVQDLPRIKNFRFQLLDTSSEPGVCLNWPLGAKDSDYDLRLATAPMFAGQLANKDQRCEVVQTLIDSKGQPYAETRIDSYDFGGRASLLVICELADGREIVGVMKSEGSEEDLVRLPKMNGPDWIAESWRKKNKVEKMSSLDDDEKVDGQQDNGDGFTLYEEYRGWAEAGKHIEGDPAKKDFFVRNTIGADAKSGIALFARVSKLKVHSRLRAAEFSEEKRVMNGNRRDAPQRVKQHGVLMEKTQGQGSFGGRTMGMSALDAQYAFRPGKVWRVRLEFPTDLDGLFSAGRSSMYNLNAGDAAVAYDRGVAHELLHSVGVDHHGVPGSGWMRYFQSASDPGNPTHRARFVDNPPGKSDHDLTYGPFSRTMTPETLAKDLMRNPSGTLLWEDTGQDIAEWMAAAFERALAAERARRVTNPPSVDAGERATRFAYYGKDAHFWRESDVFDSTVHNAPQFQLYVTREEPGMSCSGDEACLMRYYFANAYPVHGRKDTHYVVRPGAGANRAGLELCRSPAGTLHNSSSNAPQSRFGDAAAERGNCFNYICPNDAIPPRKL